MRVSVLVALLIAGHTFVSPAPAGAQALGTFRWQLQPYCNVVTVQVTQSGSIYTLDGYDDQCGASPRAPLTGTAVPNPDGTAEIGLNIVVAPAAAPLHVAVPLNLRTLAGPWRDSDGRTGTFAFAPDGANGGSPRPASTGIGAAAVDPTEVQLRVNGSCPAPTFVQGVNQDGTVQCGPAPNSGGDVTAVRTPAGSGLQGGDEAGVVNLSLLKSPAGTFNFSNPHGFYAAGSEGAGDLGVSGPGTRVVWYPRKSAFRAGRILGTQWDDAQIGVGSVAFGLEAMASGTSSVAMGSRAMATGGGGVALGFRVVASGDGSVVLGSDATAATSAFGSFVFGDRSTDEDIATLGSNEFIARASGGVAFYTNPTLTAGVTIAAGGSSWSSVSDRNRKENFRDLSGEDVLAKLAQMPIQEWNYTAQDASIRHVGPTAQDFHAAFGLGEDPLRINTIDADGVALRAIQALEARTRALEEELAALRAGLAARR